MTNAALINLNQNKQQVTITSLEIAEVTSKLHKNVVRDIEEQLGQLKFELSNYLDSYTTSQNKQVKMYRLPKREALIVISGYDVKLRAKIIDKLEELENKLRNGNFAIPQTFAEALSLAAEQARQLQALEAANMEQAEQLAEQAPKVAFANAYSASNGCMLIRDYAKYLRQKGVDIGEKRLFEWLRFNGYLTYRNNFPTQKAMDLQLFNVQAGSYTNSKGEIINTHTSKLTPKGQVYFLRKMGVING